MKEINPEKVRDAIVALYNAGAPEHARTVWDLWDLVQWQLGRDSKQESSKRAVFEAQRLWQRGLFAGPTGALRATIAGAPVHATKAAHWLPPGFLESYGSALDAADPCACPDCGATENPHVCPADEEWDCKAPYEHPVHGLIHCKFQKGHAPTAHRDTATGVSWEVTE